MENNNKIDQKQKFIRAKRNFEGDVLKKEFNN